MKNQAYFRGERGWGRVIGKQFQMPSTESVQRVVKVTNHQIFSGDKEMRKLIFRAGGGGGGGGEGGGRKKIFQNVACWNVYPIC